MAPILSEMRKATKAIYAGLAQLIASLVLVTNTEGVGFGDITTNQWLIIAGAVIASAGGVYGFTNKTA